MVDSLYALGGVVRWRPLVGGAVLPSGAHGGVGGGGVVAPGENPRYRGASGW